MGNEVWTWEEAKDVHKPGIKLLEKQRQRAWAGYQMEKKKKKKNSKSSEITVTAVVKSEMIRLENVRETPITFYVLYHVCINELNCRQHHVYQNSTGYTNT